jgi:outer membrane immunogenic protein
MKSLLIACSIFALGVTSAVAADLAPQPVEPVVPIVLPYSWTGFYVGAHAGAVFSNASANAGITRFNDFDDTGFIGGAHAGYNYQFPSNFVIGLEGDIDYTSLNKDYSFNDLAGTALHATVESQWQASIRARVGYAFDRFLPYLTGGVAFGDQKYDVRGTLAGVPIVFSNSNTRTGWTVGGGLEYAVTDNWLVRGEVRYTDFGTDSSNVAGLRGRVKFNEVSTTLGVSYKF